MKSNLPETFRGDSLEIPADVRVELNREASRLGSFAERMYWLSSTGSTNDVAARLAELGAEEGTVVVAEAQTSGRGRLGRVWFSPPGAGLYVSIVIRPSAAGATRPSTLRPFDPSTGSGSSRATSRDDRLRVVPSNVEGRGSRAWVPDRALSSPADPAALLTIASGVAIAEGVRASTGLPAEIKWPNDVMIGKRKLAGILAETTAQAGSLQHIVLGFGVNLHPAAYPLELADRVTSIAAETSRPVDRALILTELLAAIAARYADLREGRFDAILSAWRRFAPSLSSAWVEWDSPAGVVRGRVEDIDSQGALLVRVDGKVERLISGEVRWL